jgi:hypothetical protein
MEIDPAMEPELRREQSKYRWVVLYEKRFWTLRSGK